MNIQPHKIFLGLTLSSMIYFPLFPTKSNANDLDSYWFGFGVGVSASLCSLEKYDHIPSYLPSEYVEGVRIGLKNEENKSAINLEAFQKGLNSGRKNYPNCDL